MWKGLKHEYELGARFDKLLTKLDVYKDQSRLLLDIRNARSTVAAEKIIILLIAFEILQNAYFHVFHL